MSRKINPMVDLNTLPTLPAVAMEAIRLMEGEEANFSSIADLLRTDQVLAGKILHYANSAFIGSRRKITTIPKALTILGLDAVRSIILSAAVFDYCSAELAPHRQKLLNFWLHSIGVAVTAEILARKLGFPKPEEAYIPGLLHDLGKLACFIQAPARFAEVQLALEKQGSYSALEPAPLEVERSILGTDHLETGRLLAEQWGFPRTISQALWLHHQPVFETILPEEANLPQLIRFADLLCVTHNVGSGYMLPIEVNYSHEQYHFALENLLLHHHLTPAEIDGIMKEVIDRVRELGNILGFWDENLYRHLVRRANISLGSLGMKLSRSNRQLTDSNKVLDATCEMSRRLRPGIDMAKAAAIIAESACKAFGAERSLCLLRDEKRQQFTGQLLDHGSAHQLRIDPDNIGGSLSTGSDIENEAIELLCLANRDQAPDNRLQAGTGNLMAGSSFLAAFFTASDGPHPRPEPILGELVVDFTGSPEIGENRQRLLRNFESLVLTAGSAVERLLLEIDLSRQTRELAEAARKMEESQRQLFHSHRLATVGRLAAGAAHEINNPLTIISLNLQLMERLLDQEDTPALKERMRVIAGQEERIAKIIHDLLSFARPTQPKFTSSSAAEIAANVLSVLGARVSTHKIKINNHLSPELPAIMVDPLQIEQIFMNLFINASQAMPKGGELTIAATPGSDFLEIRVSDSGKGIAARHLNKIFDPFFTTKKEGEGTGLGLAICHSIAEHNGGTLRVRSQIEQGTTFLLNLPLDKGSRLRAMKERLGRESSALAPEALPTKIPILVVDDEQIINEMVRESLHGAGYAVDGAYDGLEAIELLRRKPYRLLVLDIRMPNKDGLEVLEFVKNEYPEIQVVIITAYASREEIKETARMGAFACLRKPFRLEQVLETISRALNGKGAGNPSGS